MCRYSTVAVPLYCSSASSILTLEKWPTVLHRYYNLHMIHEKGLSPTAILLPVQKSCKVEGRIYSSRSFSSPSCLSAAKALWLLGYWWDICAGLMEISSLAWLACFQAPCSEADIKKTGKLMMALAGQHFPVLFQGKINRKCQHVHCSRVVQLATAKGYRETCLFVILLAHVTIRIHRDPYWFDPHWDKLEGPGCIEYKWFLHTCTDISVDLVHGQLL